jgi:hypothetical protein
MPTDRESVYDRFRSHPEEFCQLAGIPPAHFDWIYIQLLRADRERPRPTVTRSGRPRLRAPGAGRRPRLDRRDQLLLAVAWLMGRATYIELGAQFGLDRSNAYRHASAVRRDLDALGLISHTPS